MASVTQKLNCKFHLILINLNLKKHMWLWATLLDSTDLSRPATLPTSLPSKTSLHDYPTNESHALKDVSIQQIAEIK